MVGFRNIAVHEYQKLDTAIVESIIERNLDDVLSFANLMLQRPTDVGATMSK
jgi:uncharacterized protein YutE (UPF0331/DUF86 family)